MNERKKLLILGGSKNSIQILETAQKLGYLVGVVDYYDTSECKAKADFSHKVDVIDIKAVSSLIKDFGYDGIITGYSEQLLLPYAQICEKTGLKCYGSKKLFDISTNKERFKSLCRRYDVPIMPEYSEQEARQLINNIKLVVKPVDSAASMGVSICENMEEIESAILYAREVSKTKNILIERCAEGPEATFFYLFRNGIPYFTIAGDRLTIKPCGQNLPLPVGYIFPVSEKEWMIETFNASIKTLFKNEGFHDGMAFAQTFKENDGIYLCEIGYRLTPSFETFLINKFFNIDPIAEMIKYALGETTEYINIPENPIHGANITLLLRTGRICNYIGIEDVLKLPYVIKVLPAWGIGHTVKENQIGTLAQVGVRIIISGTSRDDIISKMDLIKNMVSVLDENGDDMIIKNYSYKELCK